MNGLRFHLKVLLSLCCEVSGGSIVDDLTVPGSDLQDVMHNRVEKVGKIIFFIGVYVTINKPKP